MAGLFLGIVEELQILNRRASLRGKGQHNLFVQFAELLLDTLWYHFVGERKMAEELALALYRDAEEGC
ncbi:MAG: hypothetical protein EWM73_02407 [Nitrospira sp.]|nr:MAG: hypothetical protein EWM73_02407 [Nitrospira sp.]